LSELEHDEATYEGDPAARWLWADRSRRTIIVTRTFEERARR